MMFWIFFALSLLVFIPLALKTRKWSTALLMLVFAWGYAHFAQWLLPILSPKMYSLLERFVAEFRTPQITVSISPETARALWWIWFVWLIVLTITSIHEITYHRKKTDTE